MFNINKMQRLLVLLICGTLTFSEKVTFDNYKVFRIIPSTNHQINLLQEFENYGDDYMFWKGPSFVNQTTDLMVSASKIPEFVQFMKDKGFIHQTYIENVQDLIDTENPKKDSLNKFENTKYYTLNEIYDELDRLENTYKDKVNVVIGGSTYEKRQIKGIKLSFGRNKPGIFMEGGIHAREWISPATIMYIIDEFLTSTDPSVKALAQSYDWYMFPSVNPDGYVFTHTANRLWRKTRQPYGSCFGADPNRNWGYKWMQGGASTNPCSETHAGSRAFSEPETKTLSQFLTSMHEKIFAYISFHSYSQLLLFPYGHTTQHLDNYKESLAIGKAAITALAKRYGTRYVTGNIAETIYIASGSSMDWVKGSFQSPVTFTYELRDTGRHGFLLPANQIIPNGREVMDSLIALFKEAERYGYPSTQH